MGGVSPQAAPPSPPGDPQLRPLLEAAGSDVSHWFDPQTGDPLTRVDPQSGLLCCCVPGGPGGAPPEPRSDWAPPETPPWWEDPRLEVGRLTAAPQHLRLCNTLTGQEHVIEVAPVRLRQDAQTPAIPIHTPKQPPGTRGGSPRPGVNRHAPPRPPAHRTTEHSEQGTHTHTHTTRPPAVPKPAR
uniref:Uncharacterized protein n=1 Tax=Aquila chrysaetos chrysaetos TaxID=223781 RepID=A0A663F4I9_AQUCH